MKEITLNRRELETLLELYDKLYNCNTDQYKSIRLASYNDSGIGSVLTATFVTAVGGIQGEFTVTITDESHW